MADEVEYDETPAVTGHVSDQPDQIALGKMVSQTNRDRDICPRERFGYRVAGEYRHRGRGRGRAQVETDNVHTEPPTNLLKKGAVAAADVEHDTDRDRILTQKAQDRCSIAEPSMCPLQLPVGPCYRIVGKGTMILEKLRLDTTSRVSQFCQPKLQSSTQNQQSLKVAHKGPLGARP